MCRIEDAIVMRYETAVGTGGMYKKLASYNDVTFISFQVGRL